MNLVASPEDLEQLIESNHSLAEYETMFGGPTLAKCFRKYREDINIYGYLFQTTFGVSIKQFYGKTAVEVAMHGFNEAFFRTMVINNKYTTKQSVMYYSTMELLRGLGHSKQVIEMIQTLVGVPYVEHTRHTTKVR